jgi:hypothetical protein
MEVISLITDLFEVNKILLCLKKNNALPFDKVEIKPYLFSFPFTAMEEEIPRSEKRLSLFSVMPWKLHIFYILDRMLY